jgi:hypothetical protein
MRSTLYLCLSQFRCFWWLRSLIRRMIFLIKSNFFGVTFNIREERINFQSLRGLLQITQAQLFLAILLSISLQLIDPLLYPVYQLIGLRIPDDTDYVTLLATVSGIGGVFIGLYYAGISNVGGAIYSRVPNNIRDLLARERIGNIYMRYLAMLTFLGICLIGLRVLGFPRIYLAVPIVTISVGVGIIAFVKLGQRAFYLFDPTALSNNIFEELRTWVKMASVAGFQWNDPSFQAHANKRANLALTTLDTLSDITAKEPHLNGKPFADLARNIIGFLIFYEPQKRRIPTGSHWFEQQYVQKEWYRTEDTSVSIAHQTGTAIQPETASNKQWLEAKVLSIVINCIRVNMKGKRFSLLLDLLSYIDAYMKCLAKEGQLKQCFDFLSNVAEAVFSEIPKEDEQTHKRTDQLEKLALAEYMAYLPISIGLAYLDSIEYLSNQGISKRLKVIKWKNGDDVYFHDFRAFSLPRLEWLRPRIGFEINVEGEEISPIWYLTELLLQVEAEQFVENIDSLISRSTALYHQWIDLHQKNKDQWLVGAILSREWENWHKIARQIEKIRKIWDDISEGRHIEGLPWPRTDPNQWRKNIQERQKEILKYMAKQGTILSLLPRPDGFPDYAGQFLHTAGETAFEAMYSGDLDIFRSIFKNYFYGCLVQFDKLRPKGPSDSWRTQQDFKIAAAPIMDMIDLSGYALLFGDYHKVPDLWKEVTGVWDEYLNENQSPPRVALIAAAVGLTEAHFEIPHRAVLRTTWHQKINHLLTKVPRKEMWHHNRFSSDSIVVHDSPLVRIFGKEPFGGFRNGIDIFISMYLRKRPDANGLDFGWKKRDLEKEIELEKRHYDEYKSSSNDEKS